jgi:putative peptide zinc metalloprotease protein
MVPWPGRISASALLRPAESWPIFVPSGAQVAELPHAEGQRVQEGDLLIRLYVPDLTLRRAALQARIESQRWQAASSGLDSEWRKRMLVNQETLQTLRTEMAGLQAEQQQFSPRAPFSGHLRDLHPDLQVGQWLSGKEKVATLVREGTPWVVETWLDEEAVQRLRVGDQAVFLRDSGQGPILRLKVSSVDRDASRLLPRKELAAPAGGHVLVRESKGQLVPERAMYRVIYSVDELPVGLTAAQWRGTVLTEVQSQAPAWRYLRNAAAVMIREFGF